MGQKRVVIAVGGTGGHLLPAQRFAEALSSADILFAGYGLSQNPYFDRAKFSFQDVESLTPFRKGVLQKVRSVYPLLRGVWQSIFLLHRQRPDLVVGFGSFHAFPVLLAAIFLRVPIALFESNAIPGKVIRLFSQRSQFTAISMEGARRFLKGNVVSVQIPAVSQHSCSMTAKEARISLNLSPDVRTLLVFGGSQGSQKINESILAMLPLLKEKNLPFQLIHLTGTESMAARSKELCALLQIPCYSVPFERQMDRVWRASDLVICRAGAMTIREILEYEVPPILIPYPFASDRHQEKNAEGLKQEVEGALCFSEDKIDLGDLVSHVGDLLGCEERLLPIRQALRSLRCKQEEKPHLASLAAELLERGL